MTGKFERAEYDVSLARRTAFETAQTESDAVIAINSLIDSQFIAQGVKEAVMRIVIASHAIGAYEGVKWMSESGPTDVDDLVQDRFRSQHPRNDAERTDLMQRRFSRIMGNLELARLQRSLPVDGDNF
jgi:hypothetical protein